MSSSSDSTEPSQSTSSEDQLPDYLQVRDRPLGVSILACLHLIGGIGLFVLMAMFIDRFDSVAEQMREVGIPPWALVSGVVVLALLGIISGVGMFRGTKWSWSLAAFYYAYSITRAANALVFTYQLADALDDQGKGPRHYYLKYGGRIVVGVLLLMYLFSDRVLEYFGLGSISKPKALGALVVACITLWLSFSAAMLLSRG